MDLFKVMKKCLCRKQSRCTKYSTIQYNIYLQLCPHHVGKYYRWAELDQDENGTPHFFITNRHNGHNTPHRQGKVSRPVDSSNLPIRHTLLTFKIFGLGTTITPSPYHN